MMAILVRLDYEIDINGLSWVSGVCTRSCGAGKEDGAFSR